MNNSNHFAHFHHLPRGSNILYTMTLLVLGLGYLFAMIYLYVTHAGLDGKPGLSEEDLVIAYSGSQNSRLETAIKGPMSGMLHNDDIAAITAWVRSGADRKGFEAKIASIVQEHCLMCHDGSNPHVPNLQGYSNVKKMAQLDTGMDILTLVRVSHIHLFGMTFIFFITSSIFVHAYVRPLWFKHAVIAIPFIAIILDVSAWYLTKVHASFAWVMMIGGVFMALAFAIQWIVSMYQMWLYKLPVEVAGSGGDFGDK